MDISQLRKKAPVWPPFKRQYQNLSSEENLPLERQLLTASTSSPYTPYTPYKSEVGSPPEAPYSATISNAQFTPPTPLPPKSGRGWLAKGWRGGARIAFFSSITVLIINIIVMIWMSTAYEYMDGQPVIYRGTCEDAEFKNSGIHLAVNTLSTIVLAASNYCMQLLSAPNRNNIDKAHARGHWLDIGIPSIRNLRFLSKKRQVLWFLLALTSIPLHLVYNSVFYAAIATNNYNILYATDDFVKNGTYDKIKFPDSAAQNVSDIQARSHKWKTLDNRECIQQYGHDFITAYRNVIAVVKNVTSTESLLEITINELPPNGNLGPTYDPFAWICNDTATSDKTGVYTKNSAGFVPCNSIVPKLEEVADTWWKSGGFHIDHCLAESIKPDCHLHFAPQLMGPVILFNLVKTLIMFYVSFRLLDRPLITLGDAIDSFIRNPDPTTQGICLASAKHIEKNWLRGYTPTPIRYSHKPQHWYRIVTRRQWILLAFLFLTATIAITVGLTYSIKNMLPSTISAAWSLGLGTVRTQNLILGWSLPSLGSSAVLLTAIIANSPQVAFSIVYIAYNTVFTTMFVGEDWDRFGSFNKVSKRPVHRYLRVSEPRGNQKSTHFLTLPYRYAIPFLTMSGVLHWLMSQTIFLANISVIPRDGTLPRQDEITTCAYSPQGMILLLVLGFCLLFWLGGNALRMFGGHMSLVGCNSAAISAACHVSAMGGRAEREEMVLRKIAWGDVRAGRSSVIKRGSAASKAGLGITSKIDEEINEHYYERRPSTLGTYSSGGLDDENGLNTGSVGHCSFSDAFVFMPEEGKLYS